MVQVHLAPPGQHPFRVRPPRCIRGRRRHQRHDQHRAELDDAIGQAVTGLRAAGYSWADIAARLGVTRQAAQQRWGRA